MMKQPEKMTPMVIVTGLSYHVLDHLRRMHLSARRLNHGRTLIEPQNGQGRMFFVPGLNGETPNLEIIWVFQCLERMRGRKAVIFCHPETGKPLRAFWLPKTRKKSRKCQASFSIAGSVVSVTTNWDDPKEIIVEKHTITILDGPLKAEWQTVKIWKGCLPEFLACTRLSRFHKAAKAAVEKAECQHCTHMHFGLPPRNHQE